MSSITRFRGDTNPIRLSLTSDGSPLDVTNCSFLLTVNEGENPEDTTYQVLQSIGEIIAPASDGIVEFPIDGTTDAGRYYYDVQMTDASGKVKTVAKGIYFIRQDITKTGPPPLDQTWTWDNGSGNGEPVDPQTTSEWQYYDRNLLGAYPAYGKAQVDGSNYMTLILGSAYESVYKRSSIYLTGEESPVEPATSYELYAQVYADPTDSGQARQLQMGFTTGAGVTTGYGLMAIFGSYLSIEPSANRIDGEERLDFDWSQVLTGAYHPTVECSMGLRLRLERDTSYLRFKLWKIWETGEGISTEPSGWDYERQDLGMADHPRLYPYFVASSWGDSAEIHLISVQLTEI